MPEKQIIKIKLFLIGMFKEEQKTGYICPFTNKTFK